MTPEVYRIKRQPHTKHAWETIGWTLIWCAVIVLLFTV